MTEKGNLSIFQVGLIYIEKKLSYCKYTRWIWKESGFENKERKEILDFKILLFCCLFVVHQRGVWTLKAFRALSRDLRRGAWRHDVFILLFVAL